MRLLSFAICALVTTLRPSVGLANWTICDGYVTEVLSSKSHCGAGARVGFQWTGGDNWLCSANANMDALIITAYTAKKKISVRDDWPSCNGNTNGITPNHIWFQE